MNENINIEIIEGTPEQIALKLFSNDVKPPNTIHLFIKDINNKIEIFEILLTILFDGLNIMLDGLYNINHNDINNEHLEIINPWFESIGFKIIAEISNVAPPNYYCRILLNNNDNKGYFFMKNIDKPYTFIINGKFNNYDQNGSIIFQDHNLEDFICIMQQTNTVLKISFTDI